MARKKSIPKEEIIEEKVMEQPTEEIVEGVIENVETIELSPTLEKKGNELMIPFGSMAMASPADVIKHAVKAAKALADIVDSLNLFFTLNRGGKITKYVYVDGWEVLGGMLGVGAHEESSVRLENGSYEASVVLKRHSDGAIVGRGSALCGIDEKDRNGQLTWGNRDEFARKSMATTRATGKAYRLAFSWIMKLAGYEGTPAEEMLNAKDDDEKKQPEPEKKKVDTSGMSFDELVAAAKEKWNTKVLPPPDKQKGVIVAFGAMLGLDNGGNDIKRTLDQSKKKFADFAFAEMIDFVVDLARYKNKLRSEGKIEDHA